MAISDYATKAFAITPHNTDLLATIPKALYVGAAGSLVVTLHDGTDVTFAAVPAGTTIQLSVKRVKATGTSASSIVGLL